MSTIYIEDPYLGDPLYGGLPIYGIPHKGGLVYRGLPPWGTLYLGDPPIYWIPLYRESKSFIGDFVYSVTHTKQTPYTSTPYIGVPKKVRLCRGRPIKGTPYKGDKAYLVVILINCTFQGIITFRACLGARSMTNCLFWVKIMLIISFR